MNETYRPGSDSQMQMVDKDSMQNEQHQSHLSKAWTPQPAMESKPKAKIEVEETLQRIKSHSVMVLNNDGVAIVPSKSSLDEEATQKYADRVGELVAKARSVVRDLDPTDDLSFLRIRSKNHEIMVAPDSDYLLVVVQNPSASS